MAHPRVGILAPISHNIPPDGYGPWETVVYNLTEGLVDLGVDVTVYATHAAQVRANLHATFDAPFTGNEDPAIHRAHEQIHIVQGLKDLQSCDIIHNHLNIHPLLFAELINTPVVTTLHGAACEKDNHPYYRVLKHKPFISLSQAERSFMPDLNYIDTVYNGVDFDSYTPKEHLGEYLVCSGRVVKEKGVLSAIELAHKTHTPLKIAGPITDQKFFDEHVQPHIDGEQIQYVGNLNKTDLNALLHDALALVFFPEWNDPCPLGVIDALATGLPVIGNYTGATAELVFDTSMGLLVHTVDEAVEQFATLRTLNPVTCREQARTRLSREVMAQRYLDNYKKILDGRA